MMTVILVVGVLVALLGIVLSIKSLSTECKSDKKDGGIIALLLIGLGGCVGVLILFVALILTLP